MHISHAIRWRLGHSKRPHLVKAINGLLLDSVTQCTRRIPPFEFTDLVFSQQLIEFLVRPNHVLQIVIAPLQCDPGSAHTGRIDRVTQGDATVLARTLLGVVVQGVSIGGAVG